MSIRFSDDDDIFEEYDQYDPVEPASPELPLHTGGYRPRRRMPSESRLVFLLRHFSIGLLIGAFLLLGVVLIQGRRFPLHALPSGESSFPFDEDFDSEANGDVETNQEARPEYALPVYAGDSSALTIRLDAPAGSQLSASQLYQTQRPATVSITVYAGTSAAYGSGMVLTPDGYILTCAHVVADTESCVITMEDGTEYEAEQVGIDEQSDLAVLKIPAENLPTVTFADSDSVIVGDTVYCIGDPLGPQFSASLSNGIVSGLDRQVSSRGYAMSLIQTTAAVNSGNSGCPLFNDRGQVIGVVNMKMSRSGFEASIDNMGLSIPSRTVKHIAEELAQNHTVKRAVLGITCHAIDQTTAHMTGMPQGLWVITINEFSDCARQGILVGDIITAVNGERVNSVTQFQAQTSGLAPGDAITLTVWRDPEIAEDSLWAQQADSSASAETDHSADSSGAEEPSQPEYHFAYFGDVTVKLVDSSRLSGG